MESEYRDRIHLAVQHLIAHLDEPPNLAELAGVAGFSPYHFHRIFAAFVGEPLGEYTRRLRLKQAARDLLHTRQSITTIALAAGYDTPAAFAKAFKKHFHQSPSDLRASALRARSHRLDGPPTPATGAALAAGAAFAATRSDLAPRIVTRAEQQAIAFRRCGMDAVTYTPAAQAAFSALGTWLTARGLLQCVSAFIGVSDGDDGLAKPTDLAFTAGALFPPALAVQPEGEAAWLVIPAGTWAVFTHTGPYATLWQSWNAIYRDWLPASGLALAPAPPYELYPDAWRETVAPRTEIHIPILD